jgi:hypothetical protein
MLSKELTKELNRVRSCAESIDSNYTMAVAFHEVWKPTAYDKALHERMGRSYAGQSFLIVRSALRREMLLALMRIWDTTKGTQSLCKVVKGRNGATPHFLPNLTLRDFLVVLARIWFSTFGYRLAMKPVAQNFACEAASTSPGRGFRVICG